MTAELERMLDAFTDRGSQDDTVAWLDKADAKRTEILEWVRINLPTVNLHDPTATTTHLNICRRCDEPPKKGAAYCAWHCVSGD